MRTMRVTFAVMLATAAIVPLLTYGVVSVYSLRLGTRDSVVEGNLNVASQAGEQIRRYISTNLLIFKALAADLENTNLDEQQQDRILKNYVLRFPEFRELTVFDEQRRVVTSSRVGPARVRLDRATTDLLGVTMSPVFVDDDLLPTTVVSVPFGHAHNRSGWLAGEFSIEELWRMVGRIRIGTSGVALVVATGGELLAHGNPDERPRVARGENVATREVVKQLIQQHGRSPEVREYLDESGRRMLGVGVWVPQLDWMVVVEQPAEEAYAIARRQERALLASISVALLVMVAAGFLWGRSLIKPIGELTRGTRAIADGRLDQRVRVRSGGELGELGRAFNRMADRLGELQENVRKQERHAVFGRVAAGLVHDLSHPFKNVQNNCRLMLKMHDDAEYRETFRRMVDREFGTIRRVFEDLRNIARPLPLERFPLDLNKLVADVAESMRPNAELAGLSFELQLQPEPVYIEGDVFALGRVFRNLILNAIQATLPGGRIGVSTSAAGSAAQARVSDTGCGIPAERLRTVFEDFVTTKRQGLGLGLAISKKIVDQLGGNITVQSEVGKGTSFVLEFARVAGPAPMAEGS
jgi:signal transduction histidine kinase